MQDITITDLIDLEVLERLENAFTKMTGMAILVTDPDGKVLTKGAGLTDYCMKYTRQSKVGCSRCEQCDRYGSEVTMKMGKSTSYMCHSGLIDFAAPIIADGKLLGSFIGGQVVTDRPKRQFIETVAKDVGVDFEEYWDALERVPVIEKERIDNAAEFLFVMAGIISNIAYGKYKTLQASLEIEKAAGMKSDFLANMSHEIRTPMNAVIGMAEMALREELTPAARDYITQIKSSGGVLLNLINDILDFSKIDSGKMDINPVEYEPLSLVSDVSNIIMTRLKDKNVELLLTISPDFPSKLYGDNLRVRQILINLANNAVKFTNYGHVDIVVDYDKIDEENIMMKVAVKDTGIGIKKEDLNKLFNSFQQLDSKRNRNIEGTGLGLAITQKLLGLMDGNIKVKSVYEKGSTFYFELPQKVIDWNPCIKVKSEASIVAIGYFNNLFLAKKFYSETNRLGVYSIALTAPDKFDDLLSMYSEDIVGKKIFLFMEEANYDDKLEAIISSYPEITGILLTDFFSTRKSDVPNLRVVRKPLSTILMSMVFNNEYIKTQSTDDSFEFDFIAPQAQVLIVDDNDINLTVARGLIEPIKMQVTCANSGKKALELISKKHYDLIFMDHMMPGLDGVETTRIIRHLHPTYEDVPIIALSANAVDGAKDMFLSEGMNDFVPKPVELRDLVSKIRKWLPQDKIIKGKFTAANSDEAEAAFDLRIGDLDTEFAIKILGSDKLFRNILKEYYKAIPTKSMHIKELEQNEDWHAYTIEVHALKSSSKQIGAMELSEIAAELEKAGNEQDIDTIRNKSDIMLQKYVGYIDVLKPYCEEKEDNSNKKYADKDKLSALFERMLEAVDNLDMDQMEEVIIHMERYSFDDNQSKFFGELKIAVGNIDVERCEEIIHNWKDAL